VSRLTVVIGAAAAALSLGVESAQACSCVAAGFDARPGLSGADAAFVGTLVARRPASPPRPGVPSSSADPDIFTFRVDDAVKGDLGQQIDVWSARSGASCGLEVSLGQQIGLFLRRDGARWTSGLCSQVSPAALREAARPLPEPNGRGPVRFLVGGGFGGARLLALDAQGRTLGYGAGGGSTTLLSVCPRGRKAVEIVGTEPARAAVRDVRTLTILREVSLPRGTPASVFCGDERAESVYVFVSPTQTGSSAILRVGPAATSVLYEGSGQAAAFRRNVAYLSAGDRGREIVRVNLQNGKRRSLAATRFGIANLAVSPSGKTIAGVEVSEGSRPMRARLTLVELGRSGPKARSVSLPALSFYGDLVWLGEARLAVFAHREFADVFDNGLRRVGRLRGWEAHDSLVIGRLAYGIARPTASDDAFLQVAKLPNGAARRVRAFPGAPAVIATVPGEVGLRSARGSFCLALERVFPPAGM
jgi:hypothetical protein